MNSFISYSTLITSINKKFICSFYSRTHPDVHTDIQTTAIKERKLHFIKVLFCMFCTIYIPFICISSCVEWIKICGPAKRATTEMVNGNG